MEYKARLETYSRNNKWLKKWNLAKISSRVEHR